MSPNEVGLLVILLVSIVFNIKFCLSHPSKDEYIELPKDRHGTSIHVGDVLHWDDGSAVKVETLTFFGEDYKCIGCWAANEDDDYVDNLSGSEVWWRK